jgi:hypothetical protein
VATAEYSVGHPKGEYPFLDGKMHGLVREWWENGQPSVETNFDKGQRHGSNKYWRKDGSLMKEQIYDHDQAVKTIHFDEHGNAFGFSVSWTFEVAVLEEAGASRDEVTHDDVFLEAAEVRSDFARVAASVSTRVVSWKDAAEMKDSVSRRPW